MGKRDLENHGKNSAEILMLSYLLSIHLTNVISFNSEANIELAKTQLHELLQNKSLAGIPLLVLGNKNDIEGSLKES